MLVLSLSAIPLGVLGDMAAGIVASIYIAHFGLAAAAVGLVIIIARLFDAVTDPFIGYLSDRTDTRWGKRKPFLFLGLVVILPAVYFIFLPPDAPTFAYFLSGFLLLYLGWTLIEIPVGAWSAEVTSSAESRNRVFMYRRVMATLGGAIVYSIPLLPVFPTTEITPDTLRWVGGAVLILLPIFIFLALKYVGPGQDMAVEEQTELLPFLRSASKNGPFLIFLANALLTGFAVGIYFALYFLYITQVQGYAEEFVIISLTAISLAIPSYFFWVQVCDRIGHFRTCSVSNLGLALTIGLLGLQPVNGGNFYLFLANLLAITFTASGWFVSLGPMLADAADFDLLKSGVNRVGKYYSVLSLINKITFGLGGGAGFLFLSLSGYDAAVGAENTPEVITNFRIVMFVPTVVINVLCGLLILKFPINRRRHRIIRKRIEQRAEAYR